MADKIVKLSPYVPESLLIKALEKQTALRAQGVRTSLSALVEVGLRELLGRRDLAAVLKKYGTVAKRPDRKER